MLVHHGHLCNYISNFHMLLSLTIVILDVSVPDTGNTETDIKSGQYFQIMNICFIHNFRPNVLVFALQLRQDHDSL